MGRNSNFDDAIHQGSQLSQGAALSQGGAGYDDGNGGWEGGLLSDVRHVITNPTQTPYIGPAIRIGAALTRSANSVVTGGLSEIPYSVAEVAQGHSVGEAAGDWARRSPFGMAANEAIGMGQGAYQLGRLGSFVAGHPSDAAAAVGKAGSWAMSHRNQARHLIASRTTQTLRGIGSSYYEHPERAALDIGLTVATGGAAIAAARAARAARIAEEAAVVGEAVGEAGAATGELGAAARATDLATSVGRESTAAREAVTGGETVGAAADATDAAESVGRTSRYLRRQEQFDQAAQEGIDRRIRNRPGNIVRRTLGKDIKEFNWQGKLKNLAADKIAGRTALSPPSEGGGTLRELIAQHISADPHKPVFSENVSDWGRSFGEMKWRRAVASGDIESARKLNRISDVNNALVQANQAVRNPVGYAMNKIEENLGIGLTPDQIKVEEDRRSRENNDMPSQPSSPLPPPSGPPAPPGGGGGSGGSGGSGGTSRNPFNSRYTMGRGFRAGNLALGVGLAGSPFGSKPSDKKGFWEGRPEFTGVGYNYDRGKLRPLTVGRRRSTMGIGIAAAPLTGEEEGATSGRREGSEGNFQEAPVMTPEDQAIMEGFSDISKGHVIRGARKAAPHVWSAMKAGVTEGLTNQGYLPQQPVGNAYPEEIG